MGSQPGGELRVCTPARFPWGHALGVGFKSRPTGRVCDCGWCLPRSIWGSEVGHG